MSDRMSEHKYVNQWIICTYLPDNMSEYVSDRMPDAMSDRMPHRLAR